MLSGDAQNKWLFIGYIAGGDFSCLAPFNNSRKLHPIDAGLIREPNLASEYVG
jgi:hypothetical protein